MCAYAQQRSNGGVQLVLQIRSLPTLLIGLLTLLMFLALIFVQNVSPLGSLDEAAEAADFPNLDPDPYGHGRGVTKVKV